MPADVRTIVLSGVRAARNERCRADRLLLRAIEVAATHGIAAEELASAAGTSIEQIDRIVRTRTAAGRDVGGSQPPRGLR